MMKLAEAFDNSVVPKNQEYRTIVRVETSMPYLHCQRRIQPPLTMRLSAHQLFVFMEH